jgi:hypothetical protein
MSRLIELQDPAGCESPLVVRAGDVLLCSATAGRVVAGDEVAQVLGGFLTAVVGVTGIVVEPMGAPNAVLVHVLMPGRATIEFGVGTGFKKPCKVALDLEVEP